MLLTFFTFLAFAIAVISAVAISTIRKDVKSNIDDEYLLQDVSAERLMMLKLFLLNSGILAHSRKYYSQEGNTFMFNTSKEEFVEGITKYRRYRMYLIALLVCIPTLLVSQSLLLVAPLFFVFLISSLNDDLFIQVFINNLVVLLPDES